MLATWAHLDMEELVYHLKAPLEGTSKDVLWSYVWSCGMISFAVLAILIALFIILRHRKKVETAHGPGGSGCRISAAQLVGVGKIDIVQGKISQGSARD